MSIPWSSFYWRDYVSDTGHLSLSEHGAYLLLMAHYYVTARPIPANSEQLHRICRCTTDADRAAVDSVVAQFFTRDGDAYRHRRIDRELAKTADISEKRRVAAQVRYRSNPDASACVNALHMHTQPQPQPQPQKKNKPCSPNGETDPRHAPIREHVKTKQREAGVPEQWDGQNGRALDQYLKANPTVTAEEAKVLIDNRFASEEPLGDPPWQWIPKLSKYWEGPLDRFGKTWKADFRARQGHL